MSWTEKSSPASRRIYRGKHRAEHWYRDNQVYFLTARCRDQFPAFASEHAKTIFWDRFNHYTQLHGYVPWVTSLLDNHYHSIGYLRVGRELKEMMRKLHGSIAKLVNDVLQAQRASGELDHLLEDARALFRGCPWLHTLNKEGRLVPFFGDARDKDYYDGCLRDEKQGRLTYRYVLTQARRHGIMDNYLDYPHTRVNVQMDKAIARATQLQAFLYGVRYKRYM